MKKIYVKFVGIDSWNRPIFKDEMNNYYGSTDKLFDFDSSKEQVLESLVVQDLTYFGSSFDCEPMGDNVDNIVISEEK